MSEAVGKAEAVSRLGLTSISNAQRNYILVVLTLAYTLNFLDRQVLTILIEPIRKELSLSDTQIGFLTGIAFTFFYVTLSIPAARLADGWSRRKVIAIAIGVWSIMTAFCGVARTFAYLLLARMGVGVGEAGGGSPCQALVSDLFPREVRATAMSIFLLSVPLGTAVGLLWGGWAVGEFGWRGAFILAGIPGLILSPLVYFTIPEVRKGMADAVRMEAAPPPFLRTIRRLLSTGAFRNMMFASMMQTFLSLGMSAWVPPFLARSHAMSPSKIGIKLALAFAIPYAIGALMGGRLIDVAGRRDLRWHFWIPCISTPLTGAVAVGVFTASSQYVFGLMALYFVMVSLFAGPSMVIAQNLAPISFRATANAFLLFMGNSVGLGLGPQAVGIVSDLLRPAFGEESLRMTLLFTATLFIPTSFFYFRASLTYRADLAAADTRNEASQSSSTAKQM